MRRFLGIVAAALLLTGACDKKAETTAKSDGSAKTADGAKSGEAAKPPPKQDDAKVEVAADEATKKLAGELAAKVKDGQFPHADRSNKENQKAFVYLAAQSDDVNVMAAGLDAMGYSFDARTVDDDYKKVVRARLTSTQGPVLDRAIYAAKHATGGKEGDAETIDLLHKIMSSHHSPVARYEATQSFVYITDAAKNNKLIDTLYDLMSHDNNAVVSGALFALASRPFFSHKKAEVLNKAIELFKHKDPGVRGRAIYLAKRIPDDKKKVGAAIAPMLDDAHPFVKSRAADALADLKHYESIDKIVALLDDKTKNTYAIDYTRLSGKQGRVIHDGSNYSRVDDAMIWAIRDFTPYGKEGRFEPSKRDKESVDEWVANNGKAAKGWVATNKANFKE